MKGGRALAKSESAGRVGADRMKEPIGAAWRSAIWCVPQENGRPTKFSFCLDARLEDVRDPLDDCAIVAQL